MKLYASSFVLGQLEHPNRLEFNGVAFFLNAASDEAPNGSQGLPVYISAEIGLPALPSLVGMGVNFKSGQMNGHDPGRKIGIVEKVWAGDPDENGAIPVNVAGIIYAENFEDDAIAIKLNQASLGFSYETTQTQLSASVFDGRKVANVDSLGFFTGISILFKLSAAYHNTSLAASTDPTVNGGDNLDNTEIIAAIVALREYIDSKFTLLQEQQWRDQTVEFAQDYVEQAVVAVDLATETLDEIIVEVVVDELANGNDVIVINASTDEPAAIVTDIDASASVVEPSAELVALQAQLEAANATIATLNAAAPVRKSVSALDTLASKFDISASSDKTAVFASIDARTDLSVEDRLALKLQARRAQQ